MEAGWAAGAVWKGRENIAPTGIWNLNRWNNLHAVNTHPTHAITPNSICAEPPEDGWVMPETCRGSDLINKLRKVYQVGVDSLN
jgi:hypothetical protein